MDAALSCGDPETGVGGRFGFAPGRRPGSSAPVRSSTTRRVAQNPLAPPACRAGRIPPRGLTPGAADGNHSSPGATTPVGVCLLQPRDEGPLVGGPAHVCRRTQPSCSILADFVTLAGCRSPFPGQPERIKGFPGHAGAVERRFRTRARPNAKVRKGSCGTHGTEGNERPVEMGVLSRSAGQQACGGPGEGTRLRTILVLGAPYPRCSVQQNIHPPPPRLRPDTGFFATAHPTSPPPSQEFTMASPPPGNGRAAQPQDIATTSIWFPLIWFPSAVA